MLKDSRYDARSNKIQITGINVGAHPVFQFPPLRHSSPCMYGDVGAGAAQEIMHGMDVRQRAGTDGLPDLLRVC